MARQRIRAKTREDKRVRRHRRVRGKVNGTEQRPRLVVHRSLNHLEGQVVDDVAGSTLGARSMLKGPAAGAEPASPTARVSRRSTVWGAAPWPPPRWSSAKRR